MKKLKENIDSISYLTIFFVTILFFPLGITLCALKINEEKVKMHTYSMIIKISTIIITIIEVIYCLYNMGSFIRLIDSDMPLDMYHFNFLHIIVVLLIIALICASTYLDYEIYKYQIYMEFINVKNIKDLNLLMEETNETVYQIKNNIEILKSNVYILDVDVDIEKKKLIYSKFKTNEKKLSCKNCGALKLTDKSEKYEKCDFCGHKLNK